MTSDWSLLQMRGRLRMIDTQLIVLLARRFDIMREVRQWKQSMSLPLIDAQREQEVLGHCIELGESLGVPADLVNSLYSQLFAAVRGPDSGRPNSDDTSRALDRDQGQFNRRCAKSHPHTGTPVITTGRGKPHD